MRLELVRHLFLPILIPVYCEAHQTSRGRVAQWIACLTRNVEVVGLSSIKGPHCFLEQETLPLLLSTG